MISKLKNLLVYILILSIIKETGVSILFLLITPKLGLILLSILIFPAIGILILLLLPAQKEKLLKLVALNSSGLSLMGSLFLLGFFQKSTSSSQFVIKLFELPYLNLNFILGIDGISTYFLLLGTLLILLCLLTSWNSCIDNLKEFLIAFLFLNFFLVILFCSLDLTLFFDLLKLVLLFMLLIIVKGSREKKILAAHYFFLCSSLGAVLYHCLF